MKKHYIQPTMTKQEFETISLLSGSGVKSNNGIAFGGIDESGTEDPDANESSDLWGDDD